MAYARENLHPHEDLVLDLRPHWWFFMPSLLSLLGALVVTGLVLFGDLPDWLNIPMAVLVLGVLVWFVTRYVQWMTTELILTSDRLIWRVGVISKQGIEIPLERINTILFHQRILERMIGVGDLTVESASETGAQVFENMRNPSAIQNEIYLQMEANETKSARFVANEMARGVAGAQAPAAPDIPAQIAQLSALRDAGTITEDEFQVKKAQLLERM